MVETEHEAVGKSIKILLVEDSPSDALLVEQMLAAATSAWFVLNRAECLSDALVLLEECDFDVILLDLSLPNRHGLDAVIQTRNVNPKVPIIVLSELSEEDLAIRAVQASAQDYLIKGEVTSKLLVRSIRYAVEHKGMEEALRESEANYRGLYGAVGAGVVLHNAEGKVINANPLAQETLGLTSDRVWDTGPMDWPCSMFHED